MSAPGRPSRWLPNSNVRQTVVTITVAVLLVLSALCSVMTSNYWDDSLKGEVAWSAASSEIIRDTYSIQAPEVMRIAIAENKAEVLDQEAAAAGIHGTAAAFDAEIHLQWSWHLLEALTAIDSIPLLNERYALDGGGYDVISYLGDHYRDDAADLAVWVDESLQAANFFRSLGEIFAAGIVVVVGLYLLTEWIGRRSRGQPVLQSESDVELVPLPWTGSSLAAFLAWVLLGILPLLQLHAANDAAQAENASSRASVRLAGEVAGGAQFAAFVLIGEQSIELERLWIGSRDFAVTLPELSKIAVEEEVASSGYRAALERQIAVTRQMTRSPSEADGLDPPFVAVVNSDKATWQLRQAEQIRLSEEATRRTSDASILTVALLLASLAITLATLAGTIRRGERAVLVRSAPLLLLVGAIALVSLGLAP